MCLRDTKYNSAFLEFPPTHFEVNSEMHVHLDDVISLLKFVFRCMQFKGITTNTKLYL